MTRKRVIVIAVNEQGYRIGMSHHNARIPDEIIDEIRDLHEDEQIGYRRLAQMFNLPRSTIQKICNYERRAQTPDRWKTIRTESED